MKIEKNVSLREYATFKIGGKADFFCSPENFDEFLQALDFACGKMPVFILGGGSNVVFSDDGVAGIVIFTQKMSKITIENDIVTAECGAKTRDLCEFCIARAKTGLEEFFGLPGSVGGAVFMNARCYEKSISDAFAEAQFFDFSAQKTEKVKFDARDWDYKKSPFQNKSGVVLSASFKTKSGEKAEIREKSENFLRDREKKCQFKFPSAGSVFKNNRNFGKPSGKIIDEAGLRGAKIGGAKIADWHGNFIINSGNASAKDVADLVELAKKTVFEKFGYKLECEILFAGRGF